MSKLHFKSVMQIREGNPYVLVTKEQISILKDGWKKSLPVIIQINEKPDKPWHINMMPVGDGSFYLYLHGDVRKASNTKVGDEVLVDISFDSKYKNGPIHPMPSWFKSALSKNSIANKNWEKLTPSRKKEILRYFSWLKSPEAKKRNLERAMNILVGKPGRFMARSWKDGS